MSKTKIKEVATQKESSQDQHSSDVQAPSQLELKNKQSSTTKNDKTQINTAYQTSAYSSKTPGAKTKTSQANRLSLLSQDTKTRVQKKPDATTKGPLKPTTYNTEHTRNTVYNNYLSQNKGSRFESKKTSLLGSSVD